jgi:hypothetical protein
MVVRAGWAIWEETETVKVKAAEMETRAEMAREDWVAMTAGTAAAMEMAAEWEAQILSRFRR